MFQFINRWLLWGWIVLQALLQLGSIASLVDGVVEWYGFLANIVSLYRAVIRDNVVLLFSLIGIVLPGWIADVFVIWSVFFLTVNITGAWHEGRVFLSFLRQRYTLLGAIAVLPFYYFVLPFYVMRQVFSQDERKRRIAWEVIANIGALMFLLVLLLFVNQQLKKGGFL